MSDARADLTPVLSSASYWASYNIPYFEDISAASGWAAHEARDGPQFSWELDPRAKIFRRDQGSVESLSDLRKIIQYNDYQKDPFADGNPCNQIACRMDLLATGTRAYGAVDGKVTSLRHIQLGVAEAISGPTAPFDWAAFSARYPDLDTPRIMQPVLFNFTWIKMDWQ